MGPLPAIAANIPNPFLAMETPVRAQSSSPLASPDLMQALGSLFDVILKDENPTQPSPVQIPASQLDVNPQHVDTSFGDAMLSAVEMAVARQLDRTA